MPYIPQSPLRSLPGAIDFATELKLKKNEDERIRLEKEAERATQREQHRADIEETRAYQEGMLKREDAKRAAEKKEAAARRAREGIAEVDFKSELQKASDLDAEADAVAKQYDEGESHPTVTEKRREAKAIRAAAMDRYRQVLAEPVQDSIAPALTSETKAADVISSGTQGGVASSDTPAVVAPPPVSGSKNGTPPVATSEPPLSYERDSIIAAAKELQDALTKPNRQGEIGGLIDQFNSAVDAVEGKPLGKVTQAAIREGDTAIDKLNKSVVLVPSRGGKDENRIKSNAIAAEQFGLKESSAGKKDLERVEAGLASSNPRTVNKTLRDLKTRFSKNYNKNAANIAPNKKAGEALNYEDYMPMLRGWLQDRLERLNPTEPQLRKMYPDGKAVPEGGHLVDAAGNEIFKEDVPTSIQSLKQTALPAIKSAFETALPWTKPNVPEITDIEAKATHQEAKAGRPSTVPVPPIPAGMELPPVAEALPKTTPVPAEQQQTAVQGPAREPELFNLKAKQDLLRGLETAQGHTTPIEALKPKEQDARIMELKRGTAGMLNIDNKVNSFTLGQALAPDIAEVVRAVDTGTPLAPVYDSVRQKVKQLYGDFYDETKVQLLSNMVNYYIGNVVDKARTAGRKVLEVITEDATAGARHDAAEDVDAIIQRVDKALKGKSPAAAVKAAKVIIKEKPKTSVEVAGIVPGKPVVKAEATAPIVSQYGNLVDQAASRASQISPSNLDYQFRRQQVLENLLSNISDTPLLARMAPTDKDRVLSELRDRFASRLKGL